MDFRLKTFVSVARNRSFTRAAFELFITQPAVTRHIQELESQYGTTLIERTRGSVSLTKAGEVMLFHAEKILDSYRKMQFDLNLLTGNFSGELRLGASTTIAQYVLPPFLARFSGRHPEIRTSLITGNTEQMEAALLDHTIVLRESGSGTLEVIEKRLADQHIKLASLNTIMQLGSTESIKSFLANYDCVAILSIQSVTRELLSDTLKVIDINGVEFEREFSFATLQGAQPTMADNFIHFTTNPSEWTRQPLTPPR